MTGDLEAVLIGSLVLRSDAFFELPANFPVNAFTKPAAAAAFEAIGKLARGGKKLEARLVAAEARLSPAEAQWLTEAVLSGTTNSIGPYAEQVLERRQRALVTGLLARNLEALRGKAPTGEVLAELMSALLELEAPSGPETVSAKDAALATVDHLEKSKTAKTAVVRTRMPAVDSLLKIRRGNLITLAAESGVGKSTIALNWGENIARAGGPVLVHSLEMDDIELLGRMLSRTSGVNAERFFDSSPFNAEQWASVARAVESLANGDGIPIRLNVRHYSLGAIQRITEKEHRKRPLALVIVDYLQLIEVDLGKNASAEERVGTIARRLKQMAQSLQVPVLAISQFNREISKRKTDGGPPPRPRLSDLRGSGQLEQHSNAVVFLHREQDGGPNPYTLIVAKQRLGRVGDVSLWGDLARAQFHDHNPSANSGAAARSPYAD